MTANITPGFWCNKKVFLTGHTGFKGSWLSLWLQSMGAKVKGFALEPPTSPSLFVEAGVEAGMDSEIGDIRDLDTVTSSLLAFCPDILIHMAAQPLVRRSYSEPVETYATNVMGTVNVLEAARSCVNLQAIVNVTTDKCYENQEWVWGYRESEPMGGRDPYSSSKGCSELVTSAYQSSFFNSSTGPFLASARAGNVIGGGDWAEDRLIPDALRAFEKESPVSIRNPKSIRPWQHVLEPLSGYLVLAEKLFKYGGDFAEGWNFGPDDKDVWLVEQILDRLVALWGGRASWVYDAEPQLHEAQLLKLDVSKARSRLAWSQRWSLGESLDSIVAWHKEWLAGNDVRQVTINQIERYQSTKTV